MKIREITVSAGRTFNHPYEDYSNLRPAVTLVADVGEDEDPEAAARVLQRQAEQLVEDHKNAMLESLRNLHELGKAERRIASLQDQLRSTQEDLERTRKYYEQMGGETRLLGAGTQEDIEEEIDRGELR